MAQDDDQGPKDKDYSIEFADRLRALNPDERLGAIRSTGVDNPVNPDHLQYDDPALQKEIRRNELTGMDGSDEYFFGDRNSIGSRRDELIFPSGDDFRITPIYHRVRDGVYDKDNTSGGENKGVGIKVPVSAAEVDLDEDTWRVVDEVLRDGKIKLDYGDPLTGEGPKGEVASGLVKDADLSELERSTYVTRNAGGGYNTGISPQKETRPLTAAEMREIEEAMRLKPASITMRGTPRRTAYLSDEELQNQTPVSGLSSGVAAYLRRIGAPVKMEPVGTVVVSDPSGRKYSLHAFAVESPDPGKLIRIPSQGDDQASNQIRGPSRRTKNIRSLLELLKKDPTDPEDI